ncbi:UDP-N-acetylmuramoyl-tripeptide--D-alanyl-D-alanine ligase [Epibacterium ulvae]|uniref:UDP-N-acetylmuramoyl-tripeptide--D-alanyl-D- alanine ligase n=1 Tax=Epibacterium ulvae TaxID=1156985 RepID=UPI002492A42E|nr:UDP-N-acetylmuramoyl-tripeptide--D-alanyl-D-alanine ligase [Epibacterium ulvae]
MTLWTSDEAVAATGGQATVDWQVDGISIDTRTILPGDLFVALKAARDGHDFVAQALEKGAGAALVTHVPEGVATDAPLLIVDDVQNALEALGKAARVRTGAKVVAVTGSVGKTSTKEMLARMLSDQGRTHAAVASYNNHWGVPLTLARMPAETEFAVIEIGMSHPGEISPLACQAQPDVAMITTVAGVHLEAFADGIQGIAREKAAIFDGLKAGGTAVLNADVETSDILRAAAEQSEASSTLCFGETASECQIKSIKIQGEETVADILLFDQSHQLHIQSLGAHFAMNALGALACVQAVGGDVAQAVKSLALWSPVKGRGARFEVALPGGKIVVLDDSYNANPTSVSAALSVLAATPCTGRRIAFLGDMGELGAQENALHQGLASHSDLDKIDQIHCIGPLMKVLFECLPMATRGTWHETSATAANRISDYVQPGDIVLIKGSFYMQMARLVDGLREMGQFSATQTPE